MNNNLKNHRDQWYTDGRGDLWVSPPSEKKIIYNDLHYGIIHLIWVIIFKSKDNLFYTLTLNQSPHKRFLRTPLTQIYQL